MSGLVWLPLLLSLTSEQLRNLRGVVRQTAATEYGQQHVGLKTSDQRYGGPRDINM